MSSTPATSPKQADVTDVKAFADQVRVTPELADREPHVTARWMGESRAVVTFGSASLHLGGDGELNPMQALLGTLAACDVDLVSMHAAILGIEVIELWIEASGRFHVARYLGLDSERPAGYQNIDYTVHLRARGASLEQIARLRELCETSSPVGDTLSRAVPATLKLDVRHG